MHVYLICLVVLSTTATLVSSRPSASYPPAQSFQALSSPSYKRQHESSSVPSRCTSTCDPVQNEVNAGCPMTVCCTQSFGASYYDCLLCIGTALNATDYTQAQADIDQLYVSCYDDGYSLQLEGRAFPGQDLSRARSTTSRAKTSATADTTTSVILGTSTSPTSVSTPSTSISATTTLPSSASSVSSGPSTSVNGTAASSTPESIPSGSTAQGLSAGGSRVWVLVAAVIGLIVLWNS
ncbi:hypothetical protein BDR04DRAFT_1150731 [Suillus decipiens]|nr:hypothetical protein BDR04DRAFT_1150731 [Suillus decipiens]